MIQVYAARVSRNEKVARCGESRELSYRQLKLAERKRERREKLLAKARRTARPKRA